MHQKAPWWRVKGCQLPQMLRGGKETGEVIVSDAKVGGGMIEFGSYLSKFVESRLVVLMVCLIINYWCFFGYLL